MRVVCGAHEVEPVASPAQMQHDEDTVLRARGGGERKLAQRARAECQKAPPESAPSKKLRRLNRIAASRHLELGCGGTKPGDLGKPLLIG